VHRDVAQRQPLLRGQARVQHRWTPPHSPAFGRRRRDEIETAPVSPYPVATQIPDRGERRRGNLVAGTGITHGELHALRLQFVTDLPDHGGCGSRIVGEPSSSGGVTPGQRLQERGCGVTRIGPENPATGQQRRYQGERHRQGRQHGGYRTLSAHGREYASSRFAPATVSDSCQNSTVAKQPTWVKPTRRYAARAGWL